MRLAMAPETSFRDETNRDDSLKNPKTSFTIHVLPRERVLEYKGRGTGLPHHQLLRSQNKLLTLKFSVKDVLEGKHRDDLGISSYNWAGKGDPDPKGDRTEVFIAFLEANPHVKYIWVDYPCLPQKQWTEMVDGERQLREVSDSDWKDSEDEAYFNLILRSGAVNLLYGFHKVIAAVGDKYSSAFWTQFELFLASHKFVAGHGFIFDPSRVHLSAIGGLISVTPRVAKAEFEMLLLKWAPLSVKQASEQLEHAQVTCEKDKRILIPKLAALEGDLLACSEKLGMERKLVCIPDLTNEEEMKGITKILESCMVTEDARTFFNGAKAAGFMKEAKPVIMAAGGAPSAPQGGASASGYAATPDCGKPGGVNKLELAAVALAAGSVGGVLALAGGVAVAHHTGAFDGKKEKKGGEDDKKEGKEKQENKDNADKPKKIKSTSPTPTSPKPKDKVGKKKAVKKGKK